MTHPGGYGAPGRWPPLRAASGDGETTMKTDRRSTHRTLKHVIAWTIMFAIFGTGSGRAGTNAWTSIGPQGGAIGALSIDPHNPQTLYVATDYGGAFNSLDGGA